MSATLRQYDLLQDQAPSGLAATPSLAWGCHVGHLFGSGDELHDMLVPYFKAGLENNERCLWVTGAPLGAHDARSALRRAVPDLDDREASGQIEIHEGNRFYDAGKSLPGEEILAGLLRREERALADGYKGLRTNGNCAWVGHRHWTEFQEYEALVQRKVRGRRLICMCSYHHDSLQAAQKIDVIDRHDLVLSCSRASAARSPMNEQSVPEPETVFEAESATLEDWLDLDQRILDALPFGFYCCDSDGQILRANRMAVELWDCPVRLLNPAHRFCGSFRIETLDGQFVPPERSPMGRAVLHGERSDGAEALVENPDGKRWVARINVAPLRDSSRTVVGAVSCFQDITREYDMRQALERQQRTFDLAMVASRMGTWRYTLADNICLYDENAQRLYGLTEARFVHDEEGVKAKFHPDDMALMWSRVTRALDPEGDGHYDVEYRVKQPDGSWRWLSAWGTTEFEGDGAGRRPVAITGASRDLTELKQAEELHRLLVNELNHRVKNTLATVQSITSHTLRGASDLRSASAALTDRIVSLARVHDVLTARSWSAADLQDIVHRALEPFPASQLDLSGPSLDVSPRHALALSLALHELATNAVKYGALSAPEGRIAVRWWVEEERLLSVTWCEAGGPPVTPPTRRGFGSRLLEDSLGRSLGGQARLEYAADGVSFELTAIL